MQIGQLKVLRGFCAEDDPDVAVEIRALCMLSFRDIIKDIAPRQVSVPFHN